MDLQLKGKKAIVIGASRGIGKAIAEALADEGCDVAICARGQAGVDEVVAALKAKGVAAIGGAVDIADGPALKGWINETRRGDGRARHPGLQRQRAHPRRRRGRLAGDVRPRPDGRRALAGSGSAAPRDRPPPRRAMRPSSSSRRSRRPRPARPRAYGAIKAALIHYAKGVAREAAPQAPALQRGLARHGLLQGRRLGRHRGAGARLLQDDDRPQPHRPHGDARRRSPRRPCSWPARSRPSPPASTWWSTAPSRSGRTSEGSRDGASLRAAMPPERAGRGATAPNAGRPVGHYQ